MIVIPAIDVRGGRCVRLLHGDYALETVYAEDPAQMAVSFVRRGASRVHIVDLDAARGRADVLSRDAVRRAVRAVGEAGGEVQLGGGVRSEASVHAWIEVGARYVIIGSLALREPKIARILCEAHPDTVLLGLDVRGDVAQAQGWTESAGDASDHLAQWRDWPAAGVVRTDVGRDGALSGPDLGGLERCVRESGHPVIASGGVRDVDDVAACAARGAAAVIVGRALYEGGFALDEALRRFPGQPT